MEYNTNNEQQLGIIVAEIIRVCSTLLQSNIDENNTGNNIINNEVYIVSALIGGGEWR